MGGVVVVNPNSFKITITLIVYNSASGRSLSVPIGTLFQVGSVAYTTPIDIPPDGGWFIAYDQLTPLTHATFYTAWITGYRIEYSDSVSRTTPAGVTIREPIIKPIISVVTNSWNSSNGGSTSSINYSTVPPQ